jgi:hypothetical protein
MMDLRSAVIDEGNPDDGPQQQQPDGGSRGRKRWEDDS